MIRLLIRTLLVHQPPSDTRTWVLVLVLVLMGPLITRSIVSIRSHLPGDLVQSVVFGRQLLPVRDPLPARSLGPHGPGRTGTGGPMIREGPNKPGRD